MKNGTFERSTNSKQPTTKIKRGTGNKQVGKGIPISSFAYACFRALQPACQFGRFVVSPPPRRVIHGSWPIPGFAPRPPPPSKRGGVAKPTQLKNTFSRCKSCSECRKKKEKRPVLGAQTIDCTAPKIPEPRCVFPKKQQDFVHGRGGLSTASSCLSEARQGVWQMVVGRRHGAGVVFGTASSLLTRPVFQSLSTTLAACTRSGTPPLRSLPIFRATRDRKAKASSGSKRGMLYTCAYFGAQDENTRKP